MADLPAAQHPAPTRHSTWQRAVRVLRKDRYLYLIFLLPFLYFLVFHYLPIYGVIIAFKNYKVALGIWGSKWVGLQLPDIARLRQRQVNDFADSGVFLELNEPVQNQAPALWAKIMAIPDARKTFIDGTMYYVPQMDSFQKILAPIPMIRRDLLDDVGLEMPDSFDELYDTLATFKREYPDSQPWTVRGGTRNLLNRAAFPMGMGWSIHWVPSEQRWV